MKTRTKLQRKYAAALNICHKSQSVKRLLHQQPNMSADHESQVENIASQIISDKTPLDEEDPGKLQKYYDYVKSHYNLKGDDAVLLVNEAFLYLKLKSTDFDPLQEGDQFGAGFS